MTAGLLHGKATLILGASQGIGAAAARHFAAEGARLVLASRNLNALNTLRDELREIGSEVETISVDVIDNSEGVSLGVAPDRGED